MSEGNLSENLSLLKKAIQFGDVEKSKEIVALLAKEKVEVEIQQKAETPRSEHEISVKVFVEDKDLCGTRMTISVKPSTKIGELKRMMQRDHGFPLEIQKWIVGKKIVKDEDSLHKLRVKSGSSIFLYLLSPQSVGITKEDYAARYTHQASNERVGTPNSGGLRTMPAVTTPFTDASVGWNPNQTMPTARTPELQRPAPPAPSQPAPPQPPPTQPPLQSPLVQPPPPPPDQTLDSSDVGWTCPQCTFVNEPTRPGCEMCSGDRPKEYKLPEGVDYKMTDKEKRRLERERRAEREANELRLLQEEEEERRKTFNYDSLVARLMHQDLIINDEQFDCPICFDTVAVGDGVTLRECLHQFCRDCLQGHITASEEAQIKCPHQEAHYTCAYMLLDCEVRALVPTDAYEKFLQRSLVQAESSAANSFHCKTPDCTGWCVYDDDVNFFNCMVCGMKNCLTCKVIHEGKNCKEYQDDLKAKAQNDEDAKKTQQALQDMLTTGDAMECPQCKVVISKKIGCDWLRCTMCKTEICWCTKGRRWGPGGVNDTSGGCKCNVNGKKCHPNCQNCH